MCVGGGLGVSSNRTYWPLNGGAIAVQPGWFQGHATALFYINMGLGENPANYSLPMVPLFQITGPSNNPYPGTFCLPQVPLPAGVTVKSGDLASIQVIEVAKHGAGQYNVRGLSPFSSQPPGLLTIRSEQCVDIIFTDDTSKIPELTTDKCFNSTDIKVNNVKIDLGSGGGAATTATLPPTRTGLFNTPSPTAAANQAAARHVSRFSALMSFMFMI